MCESVVSCKRGGKKLGRYCSHFKFKNIQGIVFYMTKLYLAEVSRIDDPKREHFFLKKKRKER